MADVIVYETTDGSVAILYPCLECGLTVEQIAEKDVPDGVAYQIMPAANIPADPVTLPTLDEATGTVVDQTHTPRALRAAWRLHGQAIVVDPAAARVEKSKHARRVRNRLLELSDVEMMREQEQGRPRAAQLRHYRQQLRDMGAEIDDDPDAITWPRKPG